MNGFNAVVVLQKCVMQNCKKEKEILTKKVAKLSKELQNIALKHNKNRDHSDMIKEVEKIQDLTKQIYNTTERLKFVECQAKNCKKETNDIINLTMNMYKNNPQLQNPKVKQYINKYSNFFKNPKNFTAKNLNQYDLDSLDLYKP